MRKRKYEGGSQGSSSDPGPVLHAVYFTPVTLVISTAATASKVVALCGTIIQSLAHLVFFLGIKREFDGRCIACECVLNEPSLRRDQSTGACKRVWKYSLFVSRYFFWMQKRKWYCVCKYLTYGNKTLIDASHFVLRSSNCTFVCDSE